MDRHSLLAGGIATVACAATIGASPIRHVGQSPIERPEWRIAQRFDDTRVVVLMNGNQLYLPRRGPGSLDSSTLTGRAMYLGSVVEIPEARVAEIVQGRASIGDRWQLDAGRYGVFALTVERLVIGTAECGEGWGVMLVGSADDAARLSRIREKYFVARPASEIPVTAPASAVGPIALLLTESQSRALTEVLERERVRTWPAVRQSIEAMLSHGTGTGPPPRWRALDDRFSAGEGRLDYDVQAFRVSPDGDPRLFVRAEWRIGQQIVFLMSAWVRVGATLTLDRSDAQASRYLRLREFAILQVHVGREYLGGILNVVDANRDGWGEIVRLQHGYDALVIDAIEYPRSPESPLTVIARYDNSC
jgi:hypothetical protein